MNYSRQHTIIAVILSSFITTLIIIGIYIGTTPSLRQEFTLLFTKSSQSSNQTFVETIPQENPIIDETAPIPASPIPTPSARAEVSLEAPSIQQVTSQPLVSSVLGGIFNLITGLGGFLLNPLAYINN